MKKLLKSKIFWIIVVIIVVVVGFLGYRASKNSQLVTYTTEAVKRGNLIQTVTATGQVESAHDISLNFKTAGKLVYLPVDEGDQVKAGQVLARLEAFGLSAQVEQYRANLASAQADLEKTKAGASAEDIKVVEEQVIKARNDLSSLRTKRDDELKTLREKNLDTLNNAATTLKIALDKVYNHLINDNLTANLQVNNNALANQVESAYYSITRDLTEDEDSIKAANDQKISGLIIGASDQLRETLSAANSFLNDSYQLADGIVLNASYSQTTKDTIKSDIAVQQSTNNTSLTALQTAKSNLANGIESYNSQIQAAENTLAIYQAQLDLKKADPRGFEIKSAEAKVAQAQAQLNQALANLADYTITSPIDGTITKVNFNIGEQSTLSEPAIKMLSTEKFEVKVDIAESDVAKIKVGDKADIELDAFGSDHPFKGAIAFIEPAQTVIQDVVYYKTTVSFDKDSWTSQIKPGMTADVTITAAKKENVLVIPQRSVKVREAVLGEAPEKFVEILVGEQKTEEKKVEIGLRGDGGLVEVLSGLNEGEKVVTFKK